MIIAFIAIAFATLMATMGRVEYYRTLRVVGASRIFLAMTILVKCAFLGIAGSWAGVWLLDFVSGRVLEYLRLSGIMVPGALPGGLRERMIVLGVIVPVVSAIPAIIRLHFKGLSRD
jgi:cell division protein FtsX